MKPTPLGPFLGMNNRLPPYKLEVFSRGNKAGDYLRNAVNVDLTNAGTLQRRKGTTLVQAGTDCHSLWAEGGDAVYVDGTELYAYPRTLLRAGLTPGMRCSYARSPTGDIYWSNGVVLAQLSTINSYFGLCLRDAHQFEFGSSRGSRTKDETKDVRTRYGLT